MMKTKRFNCMFLQAAAAGAGALVLAASAHAAYPEHAVTMIVPYPPGGTTDIAARTVAQIMEKSLGQTIVVENRAGAGGGIGMGQLARAKADGYTIAMGTIGTQSINQFLYPDLPYDPAKDFAPIALVLTTPNVIAVNTQSSIKTIKELIDEAKKKKVSFATPGVGSSVHLTGAYFEQLAGIEMLHVPFKGASASLPAVMGGQVDVLLDNLPSTLAQIKDGTKIRGIAVTSKERSPSLPDIPTVAESGGTLKDMDVHAWFAMYAPAGTPADVMKKLISSAKDALASDAVKRKFESVGATVGTLTGDELAAFEKKESERWSKLIKDRDIKPQ